MKQYIKGNITHTALNSVKYFIKTFAQCSETVVFMFLGLSAMSSNHVWDTMFVCLTIASCLIFRSLGKIKKIYIYIKFSF